MSTGLAGDSMTSCSSIIYAVKLSEPPCAERHVRWCEGEDGRTVPLLDLTSETDCPLVRICPLHPLRRPAAGNADVLAHDKVVGAAYLGIGLYQLLDGDAVAPADRGQRIPARHRH